MDRRDFLKALAVSGVAFTLKMKGGMDIFAQTAKSTPTEKPVDLIAVMGGEPAAMFKKAIAEMGGIGKFVKSGYKVVVKPNIGWDKVPELAANTNPDLVKEIVRQCVAAGAKEVIVFDNTCDTWTNCYKNSGIEAAAKSAGAKVIPANEESYYKTIPLKGKELKNTKVHEAILNCDVWINVPILKNHGGANMSVAMKNLMGIIWDRRIFHNTNLQQCIADVCTLDKKPILNVVDAYRVLKTNGPRGKTETDVIKAKGLFISQDMVAVDTAAIKFFSQIREVALEDVKYLQYAQELKVGTMDIDSLNVKRIKM